MMQLIIFIIKFSLKNNKINSCAKLETEIFFSKNVLHFVCVPF